MIQRRPNLTVPIRDRRQHKRYLTLRNFRNAVIVSLIVFVAISIRSEMRGRTAGEYGRLFQREIQTDVQQKPMEVVREAPVAVADETHADPMLVQPAARAQWLEDHSATTAVVVPVTADVAAHGNASDVAIVGGPEGLTVVRKERRKPVLSGGFGR